MTPPEEQLPVAAIDLGSNSFHMVIARVDRELRLVDRVRERVQLAAGLGPDKRLTDDAQERALACLERMGQRVRSIPPHRVRAVGTNTLRKAKNSRAFLERARAALGHPIEVVSGLEEARLIYLGVSHTLPSDTGRNLVVDIGGGSTECILGERFEVVDADSLHMGCVSYSQRFFPGGELKKRYMRRAEIAARTELQTLERRFRGLGWDTCVGASGTIGAITEVMRANGWTERGITPGGLHKLRKAVLSAGTLQALQLPGLKPERAPVLPGGLAILLAVFETLGIEGMAFSTGALREGVLYDLIGRISHEDVRDRTIGRFLDRFRVDLEQAARVERTAVALWEQARSPWGLEDDVCRQALVWSARLHEVGLVVNYTSYHKHGAYLVRHSFMPGFSNEGQQVLAALVRSHRRKLIPQDVPDLAPLGHQRILRLVLLLRLAVLLNRSRQPGLLPPLELRLPKAERLELTFPPGWLEAHPLTQADLEAEVNALKPHGFKLVIR